MNIDLTANRTQGGPAAQSPLAKVPALELDDGRVLTETRAICTWLEGRYPDPNLMGLDCRRTGLHRMADRRVEHYLLASIANAIRHTHPGLAPLEAAAVSGVRTPRPQGARDRWLVRQRAGAPALDGRAALHDCRHHRLLRHQEFARGLMKFKPGEEGFVAPAAWRDRVAETAQRAGVGRWAGRGSMVAMALGAGVRRAVGQGATRAHRHGGAGFTLNS